MKCLMFNADTNSIDFNYEYLDNIDEIEMKLGYPIEYMPVLKDFKNIILIYNKNKFSNDYGFNGKFIVCKKDGNKFEDIDDALVPYIITSFMQ